MSMRILPPLYKRNLAGKIIQWILSVEGNSIITKFGEVGGKFQKTIDVIKSGKNQGKANETTPEAQALAEGNSKWEKKLKAGYVLDYDDALNGKTDQIIEGGVVPMLAHSFEKHAEKIAFPCLVQPKLDGVRCIAVKDSGEVSLWSRTRKRITSCPHIEEAIKNLFPHDIILDGELYNHDFKNDFEKIISAVRVETPTELSSKVQYHVYDCIADESQVSRIELIKELLKCEFESFPLIKVETFRAHGEACLNKFFEKFKAEGYEGLMLRNLSANYENRRSYNLQKMKEFEDAEFKILGTIEGRGKLAGHIGAFICETNNKESFQVKPGGDQSNWALEDSHLWIGRFLTVKFQGYTKNKVPRFPVGLRIRADL